MEVFFMESKNIGLDYKNENGELRYELKNGAHDMEKADGFSAEEFYLNLDKVIREVDPNKARGIAKKLMDANGPGISFGIYFNELKDLDKENKLEKEFDYLKQFIDYQIDIFMIVNFIREIR